MKHKIKSVCPDCNGTEKTTLDGTFKEHKCACKNGEIERIYEFDIIDITEPSEYLKKIGSK